ncbi:DUF1102 domain-containing protein [Halobacterium sp. CBA1126]|uniref:DUF1102 domain-containing protein n=1 Tax=Halobacterium sp. CBA1126 TaxID=2668074 RepID=UPI0012FCD8E4|nr:DUF1102 domain-containing protein [Halobacterium sp. CBA1126]MUV60635.1 DUF1102 domain-containing protein [Halobacterium sp. CBA1126]
MRRSLAIGTALALAGALAFPSGAAPLFSGPTDDIGEDVELAPSSDYADLEDGELVVDLSAANPEAEGVNDDAVTGIADVFRVRYNGSQYAHVWLTHESEAVTFYAGGEPIESEATNVTLAPNESIAVGLRVDTTGETADGLLDEITVHARAADPEDVAAQGDALSFSGSTVQTRAPTETSRRFTVLGASAGETTTFDASRLALAGAAGDLTLDEVAVTSAGGSVSLAVDASGTEGARSRVAERGAEALGAVRVTVETGAVERATLRFSVPRGFFEARGVAPADLAVYREDGGELSRLDVERTGERDGRVRFAAETPGFSTFVVAADRARVRVADARLGQTTVAPGESASVTANVTNAGTAAGEQTVSVTVDGSVVAQRVVDVAAGDTANVSVPVERDDPGEYAVAVGGVDAGTLVVEAENETDAATAQSPENGSDEPVREPAGFGLRELLGLVALLALVAASLLLARRRPW